MERHWCAKQYPGQYQIGFHGGISEFLSSREGAVARVERVRNPEKALLH
jgi:hypothetical protein